MYGRKLKDQVLEFGHEGVLYRRSFMMYDKQTDSLWLHVTGEALKGKLKGSQLEFLPCQVTTWGNWRDQYPQTKVLLGQKADGFMGTFALQDRVLEYGLSLGHGRTQKLYLFEFLEGFPVHNDVLAKKPVVIAYNPETNDTAAFATDLDRVNLTFQVYPSSDKSLLMQDNQTKSIWNRMKGQCLNGPLKGKELKRIPATPWLRERWSGFFPKGEIVTPIDTEQPNQS